MRVLFLHNPTAGDGGDDREQLTALMHGHGYQPRYCSTKGPGWKQALASAGETDELVVVAGGDGTVAKVLRRLAANAPPVAILPNGSANNISRSLGIGDDLDEWIAGWQHASVHWFARPTVRVDGQERLFVEAAGLGVFPQVIAAPEADSAGGEEKVAHGSAEFIRQLQQSTPSRWQIELDGETIQAEAIMLEVLNVPMIGPRLNLSPGMRPGGDFLDVVCVPMSLRQHMIDYVGAGRIPLPKGLPGIHHAQRIVLHAHGSPLHVDDALWPRQLAADARVEIIAGGSRVRVLQPH
jgi:diacylglycerol kinase (ATP)